MFFSLSTMCSAYLLPARLHSAILLLFQRKKQFRISVPVSETSEILSSLLIPSHSAIPNVSNPCYLQPPGDKPYHGSFVIGKRANGNSVTQRPYPLFICGKVVLANLMVHYLASSPWWTPATCHYLPQPHGYHLAQATGKSLCQLQKHALAPFFFVPLFNMTLIIFCSGTVRCPASSSFVGVAPPPQLLPSPGAGPWSFSFPLLLRGLW